MRELYRESAKILMEGTNDSLKDVMLVLEDSESPINKKYREKLYQNIIDRAHVDFGDIPKSKGDITKYSGFNTMKETLDILISIKKKKKCPELVDYATIVVTAIENIKKLKPLFTKAYTKKTEIITLEYQIYTYTCVEATTSLISAFVNDIKTPSSVMKIELKNTKYRGDLFFIDSLRQFNKINKTNRYSDYINSVIESDKNGYTESAFALGIGAITAIALSIVPLTRKLIYFFKNLKRKLSETLATQAYFLELNKNCVEYNNTIDPKKKKKIIDKQEKLRKLFLSLSDKLKITDARALQTSNRELSQDNKTMTMDGMRDEVSDSDIQIL